MLEGAQPAGTRPEGARSEAESGRKVREMFTKIAPRYDLLNHLLSLQFDRLWRARVVRRLRPILQKRGMLSLDLCCGTGDLALSLGRAGNCRVFGVDFSHAMLVRATQKGSRFTRNATSPAATPAMFAEGDALCLPFDDSSVDLVTTAFGFRNLANYEAGLLEIRRVLKPGGTLAILEFAEPPPGVLGDLYRWYFRTVLPRIGGLVSGDRSAYSYLPASVSRFLTPGELASLMRSAGYSSVQCEAWTFGIVAFHTGVKN